MRITFAPLSAAQTMPWTMSESCPRPFESSTCTGRIVAVAKSTPAMPPLPAVAAAIEATAVPWPFGSFVGSVPKADQPAPRFRSPVDPETPVSSTAIVDEPSGLAEP